MVSFDCSPFENGIFERKTMSFHVHVLMFNEHFSQEHADAHFDGQESENNKKYDWEDEMSLKINAVKKEELKKSTSYLRGMKGEEPFEIPLNDMRVFLFEAENGEKAEIACSESLYESHVLDHEKNRLTLYLKGDPYANPIPGIYVASLEFPKELIQGD